MGNKSEFVVTTQGFNKVLAALDPKTATAALVTTMREASRSDRTYASKRIREKFNLKAGFVNKHLKVSDKPTKRDPSFTLRSRSRSVHLTDFGAYEVRSTSQGDVRIDQRQGKRLKTSKRRRRTGVTVSVERGKRRHYPSAFLAPLGYKTKGGAVGFKVAVLQRKTKSARYDGRLPLKEMKGISIASMFAQKRVQRPLAVHHQKFIQKRFPKNYRFQQRRAASRAKGLKV